MRRFILGWKVLGHERRLRAYIVNFADDFVICCRGNAEPAMTAMRDMMRKLKLTVNEKKTHMCDVPRESFDFLSYTFGRCWSPKTGKAYIGTRPSKKKVRQLRREISEQTSRRWECRDHDIQIAKLNRILVGWANYFCLGPVSKAYESVDYHTRQRLRHWLCRKHKVRGQGTSRFPDKYLYEQLGLAQLKTRTRNFPWAKA